MCLGSILSSLSIGCEDPQHFRNSVLNWWWCSAIIDYTQLVPVNLPRLISAGINLYAQASCRNKSLLVNLTTLHLSPQLLRKRSFTLSFLFSLQKEKKEPLTLMEQAKLLKSLNLYKHCSWYFKCRMKACTSSFKLQNAFQTGCYDHQCYNYKTLCRLQVTLY